MADRHRRLFMLILFIITCQTIFTVYWFYMDKINLENIDNEETKIQTGDNQLQVGDNNAENISNCSKLRENPVKFVLNVIP